MSKHTPSASEVGRDTISFSVSHPVVESLEQRIEQLERENAELLNAIKNYIAVDGSNGKYSAISFYDAKQALDIALAKAEGK